MYMVCLVVDIVVIVVFTRMVEAGNMNTRTSNTKRKTGR